MACHLTCCSRDLSAGWSVTWTGHAAASPSAQMVWPSICFVTSHNMSISSIRASPFFIRVMMSYSQGAPSLQQTKHSLRQGGGVVPASSARISHSMSVGKHHVHPDLKASETLPLQQGEHDLLHSASYHAVSIDCMPST